MLRPFALRLTSLRVGLAILAIHAMLAMGFVDAVARSAAASSLPQGVGVLCLSDWSANPGEPAPHRAGHDGSALCQLSGFHAFAAAAPEPAFASPSADFAPVRRAGVPAAGPPPPAPRREGAPVRGPPILV